MNLFKKIFLCCSCSFFANVASANEFSLNKIFREKPELIIYHKSILTVKHLDDIAIDFSTGKDVILTLNLEGKRLLNEELERNGKKSYLLTIGKNITVVDFVHPIKGNKFEIRIAGKVKDNIEFVRSISKYLAAKK